MKIACEKCHSVYKINEDNLPDKLKVKVRCRHCQHVMLIEISILKKAGQTNRTISISKNLLYGENLKKVVTGNFKKLYPMPHIMAMARQLLVDPMSDFKEISKLVKTGQALARRFIAMMTQSKMQGDALRGYVMNSDCLWRHSLVVAEGSDIIAEEISAEYSREAILTGLLPVQCRENSVWSCL